MKLTNQKPLQPIAMQHDQFGRTKRNNKCKQAISAPGYAVVEMNSQVCAVAQCSDTIAAVAGELSRNAFDDSILSFRLSDSGTACTSALYMSTSQKKLASFTGMYLFRKKLYYYKGLDFSDICLFLSCVCLLLPIHQQLLQSNSGQLSHVL